MDALRASVLHIREMNICRTKNPCLVMGLPAKESQSVSRLVLSVERCVIIFTAIVVWLVDGLYEVRGVAYQTIDQVKVAYLHAQLLWALQSGRQPATRKHDVM
jgi:hypothetical protein